MCYFLLMAICPLAILGAIYCAINGVAYCKNRPIYRDERPITFWIVIATYVFLGAGTAFHLGKMGQPIYAGFYNIISNFTNSLKK